MHPFSLCLCACSSACFLLLTNMHDICRIDDFEFTPGCAIFDLLDIPLYHGWIVDPQVCSSIT